MRKYMSHQHGVVAGSVIVGFLLGFGISLLFPGLHHSNNGDQNHGHITTIAHTDEHDSAPLDDAHDHNHEVVDIDSSLPAPQLEIVVEKDMMAGYNLEIKTANFTFAPEKASIMDDMTPNEGHAHLYVNGIKRARLYGKYFHMSDAWFDREVNMVTVSLNSNNHNAWGRNGEVIQDSFKIRVEN